MTKFGYLSECGISGATTAVYVLEYVPGRPELTVSPLTADNEGFMNAALRAGQDRIGRPNATQEELRRVRLVNAEIVADHSLRGWKGVLDENGKEVQWTREEGREFMRVLASEAEWIFERLYHWVQEPSNFTKRAGLSFNKEDTAKNS